MASEKRKESGREEVGREGGRRRGEEGRVEGWRRGGEEMRLKGEWRDGGEVGSEGEGRWWGVKEGNRESEEGREGGEAPRPCLNIKALSDQEKRAALQAELLANLAPPAPNDNPATTDTLSVRWRTVSEVLLNTARSVLGMIKRKNRDWFDEQAEDIHQLLEEKKRAHQSVLANPNARTRENLAELRSRVQRETRKMQNEWWTKLAGEIQGFADVGDQQQYGPQSNSFCPTRSADGSTLITEKSEILGRWAEHYEDLLNRSNPIDPTFLNNLPDLPAMQELDTIPSRQECPLTLKQLLKTARSGTHCAALAPNN
ncbi:hypothetical protein Pmani_025795 [Petrolisthes manimaculis]|uniref:Uncharacterized protein n=1 Tax=Petrolisthes manimaculis TaxID=1843537 RepID=A0AAE1P609_9EUCA|nr:hypothetical protein Pmani_025795 [Petrolisthes manimaculis]